MLLKNKNRAIFIVYFSSPKIRIVSNPLTTVAIYSIKIARLLFFQRQDCSLFYVAPYRMFKRGRKYRRLDKIAIRRQPLETALPWYGFYGVIRLKYRKEEIVSWKWMS
jgi:hypothetical protein